MLLRNNGMISTNRRAILFFAMMFVIQTPRLLTYIENNNQLIHWILIGSELIIYGLVFLKWVAQKRVSPVLVFSALMYGTIVLSTVINHGTVFNAVRSVIGFIFVIMLIENETDDVNTLWKACISYLVLMIVINFISILIYPSGIPALRTQFTYNDQLKWGQTAWFLTTKNGLGKYVLCLLFFKSDLDFRRYNRLSKSFFIIAAVSYISLVLIWSAASVTAVSLFLLFILFTKTIAKKKFRLVNVYFLSFVILFFFIQFVVIGNAGIFSFFLTSVLKKSLSFNGRVPIWQASIQRILERPVLGYGYISGTDFREMIGLRAASDSHNYFLTIAMYGGLVALAFLIALLIKILQAVRRIQYTDEGVILTGFLFSFFLLMLAENTSIKLFWMILAYAYCKTRKLIPLHVGGAF